MRQSFLCTIFPEDDQFLCILFDGFSSSYTDPHECFVHSRLQGGYLVLIYICFCIKYYLNQGPFETLLYPKSKLLYFYFDFRWHKTDYHLTLDTKNWTKNQKRNTKVWNWSAVSNGPKFKRIFYPKTKIATLKCSNWNAHAGQYMMVKQKIKSLVDQ